MSEPRLLSVRAPAEPEGVVLVLHGGGSRGEAVPVSATQPSVLRMIPVARRIARAGRGRLAVLRVLNAHRGWDARDGPLGAVRWALEEVADRFGGPQPTCLVGHSLGGRAALLCAGRPEVRSAVALAPWVSPTDGEGLAGRRVLLVHGTEDRIARIDRAEAVARRLAREADVGFVRVRGGSHAMLRRRGCFDGLAADFAVRTLLGEPPGPVLERIEAGERWLEV